MQFIAEILQRGQIHRSRHPQLMRVCSVIVMRVHIPHPANGAPWHLRMGTKEILRQVLGQFPNFQHTHGYRMLIQPTLHKNGFAAGLPRGIYRVVTKSY